MAESAQQSPEPRDPLGTITLNTGAPMPILGLGVYMITDPDLCQRTVETALATGYRLIDTAVAYGNERPVGRGIASSDLGRDEVFLTSKLWLRDYPYEKARASIEASLERLGTDYLDLLLLHQPFPEYRGAWRAMEEAVDEGKLRAIGVSNFGVTDLEAFLPSVRITPAVNQIEMHPYYQRPELVSYLRARGIAVESWAPLGHGRSTLHAEPLLTELATKYDKSVAQILLRWNLQSGFIAIPKSTSAEHMAANTDVFDFALTEEEMSAIRGLDTGRPNRRAPRWLQELIFPRFRPRALP